MAGGSLVIGDWDVMSESSPLQLHWQGRNLGDPMPDTQTVSRILLDGDVVSGVRSANRQIVLTLMMQQMSVAAAAAIRAELFRVVDQQQWTMAWTPDDGMSTVLFDCYRGHMERSWDDTYDDVLDLLTLTIPALPFTRDAAATVLTPPDTAPAPIVIDAMDGAPLPVPDVDAGTWQNTHMLAWHDAQLADYSGFAGDVPAPILEADAIRFSSGSGSRKATVNVTPVHAVQNGSSGELQVVRTLFAPVTIAQTLPGPVDLSSAGGVSWWTRADPGMDDRSTEERASIDAVVGDPLEIGIVPASRDDASLSDRITDGVWACTLTDSAGKQSTWVTSSPHRPSDAWGQVSVSFASDPSAVQEGFDLSAVVAYRLRLYRINASLATVAAQTGELHGTDGTWGFVGSGGTYSRRATAGVSASAATAGEDLAWQDTVKATVPTAGETYAFCGQVTAPLSSAGQTVGVAVAWFDATDTLISVSAAVTGALAARDAEWQIQGTTLESFVGESWCLLGGTAQAPAGAVTARIQYSVTAAPTGIQFTGSGPHLSLPDAGLVVDGGALPVVRYPYPAGSVEYFNGVVNENPLLPMATSLWVDQLEATPSTSGVTLAGPYGQATFAGVGGSARCPLSIDVTAAEPVNWLLVARTPEPPPGFVPVLASPTVSDHNVNDATALSGVAHQFPGSASSTLVYTLRASAYSGTYALLGRFKSTWTQAGAITVTIADSAGTTVASVQATLPNDSTWHWYTLGAVTLPPFPVSGANQATTFTITVNPPLFAGTDMFASDILTLVDLSGEALIIDGAKLTDGTKPSRFWLDAPGSDAFTGVAWCGNEADRSDAIGAGRWQSGQAVFHFEPETLNMLTVIADGGGAATNPKVGISYARRWNGEAVS